MNYFIFKVFVFKYHSFMLSFVSLDNNAVKQCRDELRRFCEVHEIEENEMAPIECESIGSMSWKGWITMPAFSQGFSSKQHQLLRLFFILFVVMTLRSLLIFFF